MIYTFQGWSEPITAVEQETNDKGHKGSNNDIGKLSNRHTTRVHNEPLMDKLKDMGPSAIDLELRMLAPDAGGDIVLMKQFMEFLMAQIATRKDFELAEAYMALFLQI
ncbi:hypothetical protein QZH41_006981 [Actinostola sp. cb2023]|nr:hypothetical protein QZH41_006981 [Actinostola sp. cb2023]